MQGAVCPVVPDPGRHRRAHRRRQLQLDRPQLDLRQLALRHDAVLGAGAAARRVRPAEAQRHLAPQPHDRQPHGHHAGRLGRRTTAWTTGGTTRATATAGRTTSTRAATRPTTSWSTRRPATRAARRSPRAARSRTPASSRAASTTATTRPGATRRPATGSTARQADRRGPAARSRCRWPGCPAGPVAGAGGRPAVRAARRSSAYVGGGVRPEDPTCRAGVDRIGRAAAVARPCRSCSSPASGTPRSRRPRPPLDVPAGRPR